MLAFATFVHLVLDTMWDRPQTLFWPFMGTPFPKQDSADWIKGTVHNLLTRPSFYVPETAGVIIMLGVSRHRTQEKEPEDGDTEGEGAVEVR